MTPLPRHPFRFGVLNFGVSYYGIFEDVLEGFAPLGTAPDRKVFRARAKRSPAIEDFCGLEVPGNWWAKRIFTFFHLVVGKIGEVDPLPDAENQIK